MSPAAPPRRLWTPPSDVRETSRIGAYLGALGSELALSFEGYEDLWQWSVRDLAAFWDSIRRFYDLWPDGDGPVLEATRIPDARWYQGHQLNYAERALRLPGRGPDDVVIVARSQTRDPVELTVAELRGQVARARAGLRRSGVGRGDRVAGYLPNIPEAVVGMLACASLGATWSSCPPEFGVRSVLDRLTQVDPKVLIAADGYRYGEKRIERHDEIDAIVAGLPGLEAIVVIDYLGSDLGRQPDRSLPGARSWLDLTADEEPLTYEPLPFDHPLYVLFSSGTTGLPKAILHSHGGMLLEHAKSLGLHQDLGAADRLLWFTTTGWMMWNYIVSGLIVDATVVLVDGDPGYPDISALWRVAAETETTYLGLGAPLIMAARKAGIVPRDIADLSKLRGMGSTGSPLPAEGFDWVAQAVSPDIPLGSYSGGTDLCTGFLGPCPLVPVWAGEISCRTLGASVAAFDAAGRPLIDAEGELVITRPMPSMPLGFLGDDDGSRYRAAYFEDYEGVWRHGDWITITDRGSCIISGRSDATLNRGGVRIGTAELYTAVEELDAVTDSLVVHVEDPGGGPGEMVLFVTMRDGMELDDPVRDAIRSVLRSRLSPRHVPDAIVPVPAIPRTLSGKKLEVPCKRILAGADPDEVSVPGTLAVPGSLDAIVEYATSRRARPG